LEKRREWCLGSNWQHIVVVVVGPRGRECKGKYSVWWGQNRGGRYANGDNGVQRKKGGREEAKPSTLRGKISGTNRKIRGKGRARKGSSQRIWEKRGGGSGCPLLALRNGKQDRLGEMGGLKKCSSSGESSRGNKESLIGPPLEKL